eukprot:8097773-Pyramimonas_sp.AAC.1
MPESANQRAEPREYARISQPANRTKGICPNQPTSEQNQGNISESANQRAEPREYSLGCPAR